MNGTKKPTQRDQIAAAQHQFWAAGVKRMLEEHGQRNADGSFTIAPEVVAEWERLAALPYGELTEEEQRVPNAQADKVLVIVAVGDFGGLLGG